MVLLSVMGLVCFLGSLSVNAFHLEQVAIMPHRTAQAIIVETYPHDPNSFTEGLEIHNNILYESSGLTGQSNIRTTNLQTGAIIKEHTLPSYIFGEGLTIFNNLLYVLTWTNQIGYVFDLNFNQISQFSYTTQGWGLTHDDKNLIMSDGSNNIYFIEPTNFTVVKTLKVYHDSSPVSNLNELEYINGFIYANVWHQKQIAIINPTTGRIKALIDCSGLYPPVQTSGEAVLNGIAYNSDNQSLYVTGKLWPNIYQIQYLRY